MEKENILYEANGTGINLTEVIPTVDEFEKVLTHKKFYEDNYEDIKANPGNYKNGLAWAHMPWAVAYRIAKNKDKEKLLRYIIISILIDWKDLKEQLQRTCKTLGIDSSDIRTIYNNVWVADMTMLKNKLDTAAQVIAQTNSTQTQPTQTPVGASVSAASASGQSANAGVTNMGVNKNFCRLIIYDVSYNPPARRHLYVSKKVGGTYDITVGGSQFGPSHSWYDEPLFDSLQQAEEFIRNVNQTNIKTVTNTHNFKYNITDKPIDLGTYQGNKLQIADLSDAVLVDTVCGPAYIQRKNKKCVESLQDEDETLNWLSEANLMDSDNQVDILLADDAFNEKFDDINAYGENIKEDVEKHDTLNPKLWNEDMTLKPEVEEKINLIVQTFLDALAEDNIKIDVDDIVIIGSNCSYNYNNGSDLDVHIRANTETLDCPEKHLDKLYSAYRSLFNKKFDIDFYGIPVELYVETGDIATVSNGIYSVKNKQWLKKPVQTDIPEVNKDEVNELVGEWTTKYNKVVEARDIDEIDKYIEDVYELRKESMAKGEEYGLPNLVFKEIRNAGYLDNLKNLKAEIKSEQLSLESLNNDLQEDTVKVKDGKWVNKGKEGTHGTFRTKKAADAQRKAMFANGYHENLDENNKLESLESTVDQDLEDNRTPEFSKPGELGKSFDANEMRKHEAAIEDEDDQVLTKEDLTLKEDRLDNKTYYDYKTKLSRIVRGQVILDNVTGKFSAYLVKENDVPFIMRQLRNTDFVEYANASAGKYDFSQPPLPGQLPKQYYTITGKVKS